MGNKIAKTQLKERDLARFAASSALTADEVKALHGVFVSIKAAAGESDKPVTAADGDLTISQNEFQAALAPRRDTRSLFLSRLFVLMDANRDGLISFEDFLTGIAALTPTAVPEKKLRFTFAIYDVDGSGRISPANMVDLLTSLLGENDVALPPAQVQALVAHTFAQEDANRDGFIDYAEFTSAVARNPNIIKALTLSVNELAAAAGGGSAH